MEVLIDGVRYVPLPQPAADSGVLRALELRFDSDAGQQLTVRDYLRTLLAAVWDEEERFDGKMPFGNSAWQIELYRPLAAAGFIDLGPLDESGYPYARTEAQLSVAHAFVHDLIVAAFNGVRAD